MQTAHARLPDYPGAAEPVFYFVENGVVTLCDETRKSTGKAMALGQHNLRSIAGILKRSALESQGSNFNRPLHNRGGMRSRGAPVALGRRRGPTGYGARAAAVTQADVARNGLQSEVKRNECRETRRRFQQCAQEPRKRNRGA